MNDDENWEDPLDDNGLTLGPEESLQREIEKSKSLKVDRLRLRDEIDQLKAQKEELKEKNRQLHERVNALSNETPPPVTPAEPRNQIKKELLPFLIAVSIFIVLYFLQRN
ncbi:MAG: hypothetical protein HOK41_09270 [Nitrospina sp.]|jgi:uncharacterized coiled-coil DUF342 family protein|nr:hypothetical protein [Nitrospina sp.]MBT6717538.1 hypothetical protein [Nitrospina sp.]